MRFLAAALAALALLPSCAAAAPGLLLGVDDDSLKWYGHTGSLVSIYRSLGLGAVRVTLNYPPDRTERTELQRRLDIRHDAVSYEEFIRLLQPAETAETAQSK